MITDHFLIQRYLDEIKSSEVVLKALEFSGSTYVCQVDDKDESYWPLVEYTPQGQLKEAICFCDEWDEDTGCKHLGLVCQELRDSSGKLYHSGFEVNFWHQLLFALSCQWGCDPTKFVFRDDPGTLSFECDEGGLFIEAKEESLKEALSEAVHERKHHDENNSIKFSNVSQEDLNRWRRGQPGPVLRYELSPWSDFAKALYAYHHTHKVALSTELEMSEFGFELTLRTKGYRALICLPQDLLKTALIHLKTLASNIYTSFSWQECIREIKYSKETGKFHISYDEKQLNLRKEILSEVKTRKGAWGFENWCYIPFKGLFFFEESERIWPEEISGEDFSEFLDGFIEEIPCVLPQYQVNSIPLPVGYEVFFDEQYQLHVDPYVYQVGDIRNKEITFFGSWAYKPSSGFQKLDFAHFKKPLCLASSQVEAFVTQYRQFLSLYPGYEVYQSTLGGRIRFEMDLEEGLYFYSPLLQGESKIKSFGRWIYVDGKGFFVHNALAQVGDKISHGMRIPVEELPEFLKENEEALYHVVDFWAGVSPVGGQFVKVDFLESGDLEITPYRVASTQSMSAPPHYFGQYTYSEGVGFAPFPKEHRLPDFYESPRLIKSEDLLEFLQGDWVKLRRFCEKIPPALQNVTEFEGLIYSAEIKTDQEGTQKAFTLDMRVVTENAEVALEDLIRTRDSGDRWFIHHGGLFDLESDRWRWLDQLNLRADGQVEVSSLNMIRLASQYKVSCYDEVECEPILPLIGEKEMDPPDLSLLKSNLRQYQEFGVHWLNQLQFFHLGGLLCDDMGLGKTHQAMGLIAAVAKRNKKAKFLVVCPTSVIYHWQDKLACFLPDLKVDIFHGKQRDLTSFEKQGQILLTSFGLLRLENERFTDKIFDLVVYDEIQMAKNAKSKLYQSLKQVKASMRLGMSGTPIENTVLDLKNLLDLVLPAYLPSNRKFKERFLTPIEKGQDKKARQELHNLVSPFILRRTKQEVLTDLPSKIEETGLSDLSSDQKALYSEVMLASRNSLLSQLTDSDSVVPYMHVFAAINALKQICDHPVVYLRNQKKSAQMSEYTSGKWELFTLLLEDAIASNQKVVVFSQYLVMLDLMEEYLFNHQISYSVVRGSTRNREEQIRRFQEDPKCRVFIGSLNAAGMGIDLTAGSVVILYDRWWNAARENQAIDRVHRIGQTRGVQVFKMMVRDSIEERIDFLISKKKNLMEQAIGVDDHRMIKSLTREEIISLFDDI